MLLKLFLHSCYLPRHLHLTTGTVEQFEICTNLFSEFLNRSATVNDLSDSNLIGFMAWMMNKRNAAPSTVNNKRRILIALWAQAFQLKQHSQEPPGTKRVPRVKMQKKVPSSWEVHQLRAMIHACDQMPTIRGWGPGHWKALLLTCYDTGQRVGAVLNAQRSQLSSDLKRMCFYLPGVEGALVQSLHEQTQKALEAVIVAGSERLFSFPFHRRRLWQEMNRLLTIAGLPNTSRDKFQRIRRTGYSMIWSEAGPAEAHRYVGNRSDVSRSNLDPKCLAQDTALSVLPRP